MINLIACVANIKNELVIGKDGGLLFKLNKDMAFFKSITTNSLSKDSKLPCNVVVMGRKTYFSIPERPLENRINLVLTRNPNAYDINPIKTLHDLKHNDSAPRKNVFFINMNTFIEIYKEFNPNVFVIGGSEIYNFFLGTNYISILKPSRLYITEVKGFKPSPGAGDSFVKMINFGSEYYLAGYSEKHEENGLSFRFLTFIPNPSGFSEESKYLELAKDVLNNGNERPDRTGVGTLSVFGRELRFDISNGTLPLLTVKRVPFKAIFLELQWMMSGYTDNKLLQDQGVRIWDGNTSREFLDSRGLYEFREGILGKGYGHQIRHQGAEYKEEFAGTSYVGGFDQLQYVEDLLENDPFSRRIMMSYWNPSDFSKTALLPCHYSIQFYVEQIGEIKYLSGMFNMRSSDELARSWNCVFYTILVQILALRHNMKPKELVYVGGDVHIYKNHIDSVKEYIKRTPRPFPKLWLSDTLKNKDWKDMKFSDVELIGYFPHPAVKMDMAV